MEHIRIYIADDHQIVIDGIELLLDSDADLLIIGSATDGDKAMAEIEQLKPDIAILDIRMPGKDGLSIVQQLHKKVPTKFIMLTMQMERRVLVDAENFGASAFLLKNSGKGELLNCIRKVLKGETHFPDLPKTSREQVLSPREMDILKGILRGLTNQQISEELNLSHYTVETHRKNIYRKTDCSNVALLMKFARDHNIDID